jgi:hypothetical protein
LQAETPQLAAGAAQVEQPETPLATTELAQVEHEGAA